jgi:hypothetical protein
LAGQKLNWRQNQVLVLSQIAKKQTLNLVKMVRHFPSCHIRYRCDFKMAALISQTIHACFAVEFCYLRIILIKHHQSCEVSRQQRDVNKITILTYFSIPHFSTWN